MHGNTSWSLHAYEILVPLPKILKVRFCHPTTLFVSLLPGGLPLLQLHFNLGE
jgi:hypothetical protein